jgi:hypothetical protein
MYETEMSMKTHNYKPEIKTKLKSTRRVKFEL